MSEQSKRGRSAALGPQVNCGPVMDNGANRDVPEGDLPEWAEAESEAAQAAFEAFVDSRDEEDV